MPSSSAVLVAPCAGAWIEISGVSLGSTYYGVAPCAGAWIEIDRVNDVEQIVKSLPARERGLKSCLRPFPHRRLIVAPCAGAWIEIPFNRGEKMDLESLPARERGLKFLSKP